MAEASRLHCRAVLFDLDGVLVDSMPLCEAILRTWATSHGLDPDTVVVASPGRRDVDLVAVVAPHLDPQTESDNIAAAEAESFEGLTEIPGALALLRSLPEKSWAIVTSSVAAVARGRLHATGLPTPSVLITADDVASGKPSPEGYSAAAARLGVDSAECIVVEDSAAGLAAAEKAGMRCIAIGDAIAPDDVRAAGFAANLAGIRARSEPASGADHGRRLTLVLGTPVRP